MDALLNERSLCGQFDDIYSFLDSVKPVIRCIELIHENSDIAIYKTADFYDCKITKDERLCDLAKYKLTDELEKFMKNRTGTMNQSIIYRKNFSGMMKMYQRLRWPKQR